MTGPDASLRARADAGDRAAMTACGKALFAAAEADCVRDGARYVERAAELGDGEACAQLSVLIAAGIHTPPDWDKAFHWLQRAAELGWRAAQEEIRFLSQAGGDDYAALRARIDIAAWLRPRPVTLVRAAPRVVVCEGFMSPEECARLIARAAPRMARADVYDPATGAAMLAEARSNSKAEIQLADVDLHVLMLQARISATIGLPSSHFEPTNVLHYKPGEQFAPHYDFLEPGSEGLAHDLRSRGQRIVTFLVYLNDDYDGGETAFPRLNYVFKGRTGDALMFGNVSASGAIDPNTLHAGLPPTRGEKWLLSQWVRDRPGVPADT